jgi:hypothetical protein
MFSNRQYQNIYDTLKESKEKTVLKGVKNLVEHINLRNQEILNCSEEFKHMCKVLDLDQQTQDDPGVVLSYMLPLLIDPSLEVIKLKCPNTTCHFTETRENIFTLHIPPNSAEKTVQSQLNLYLNTEEG